jgi:hypothetical protein
MAKIPKVEFTVDLAKMFDLPKSLTQSTRELIGQSIIDRIVRRTSVESRDKYGRLMKGYSKTYAESLAGQVYGKIAGAPANLKATGDMLGSLNIVGQSATTVTIGYDDAQQNAKAYGHISGMDGHPILDGKVPKRDFLGLSKDDVRAIKSDLADELKAIKNIEASASREELDNAILDSIGQIEGDLGG